MFRIIRAAVFISIFLLLPPLICPGTGYGADPAIMEPELDVFKEISRIGSSTGVSIAPILAYEPTFGTIFGGAVFMEKKFAPRLYLISRLAFSSEGEYSALFNLKKWEGPETYFHLEMEIDDFDRPYYGEGMDTSRDKEIFLEGTVSRFVYFLKFRENGKLSLGPFLDYRGVRPEGVEGAGVAPPEYGEATLGLGMRFFYDSRDSHLSPTSGVFDTLTIRYVPDTLSSYEGTGSFFQAEVDHRIFRSLTDSTVVAGRLHLARSWGEPSYQYRYSLGGPYELRGFYTNRFRGDSVYVAQGELRQNLFWIFSGAVFAETGEVADDRFHSPETSFGGGVRMTLPPDHIAKARLDFAWAKDQHSIYFIFGEAF